MSGYESLRKKALRRSLTFLFLCASVMLASSCVLLFYGEFFVAFLMILAVVWTVILMAFYYFKWNSRVPHDRSSRRTHLLIALAAVFVWQLCYVLVEDGGMRWGLLSGLAFLIGYFGLGAIFGFPNGSNRN